jgi:predicted acetyltransferase
VRTEIKAASEMSQFEKARVECVVTSSLYAYHTGIKWADADWAVMVWEDEDLVTNVHIVERNVLVGGKQVRLGGIGNVATKTEWRKRGYAKEALKLATEYLFDPLKVDFGLMVATESIAPAYAKVGWEKVGNRLWVEQPGGRTELHFQVLVLPVEKKDWPIGEIDLCGLPW